MGFSKLKCKFKYGFSIVYQKKKEKRKEKEIKAVFLDFKKSYSETLNERVKVPVPAHQVWPLKTYNLEASYSTWAKQVNKI